MSVAASGASTDEPRAGDGMDRAMELMRDAKTIVIGGVSSKPDRPSNEVALYLQ
jgi:predicted CoA-binding protein